MLYLFLRETIGVWALSSRHLWKYFVILIAPRRWMRLNFPSVPLQAEAAEWSKKMAKFPFAIFDIETIVDWQLVEQVEQRSKEEVLADLRRKFPEESDPFISYVFHLPIAISIAFSDGVHLERVGSLQEHRPDELARKFWGWAARYQDPQSRGVLVSFNGRGFDIPVLELAALRYGISAPWHFNEKYGNRYRFQDNAHVDVMDYLTAYGAARLPKGGLSTLSAMVGLPAKGISGGDVESMYRNGEIEKIKAYCRDDCRRLFAVFNRLMFMRGLVSEIADPPELELK